MSERKPPKQLRVVIEEKGSDKQAEVTAKLPISLGRNAANDVVLENDRVSRHHAEIRVRGNQVLIVDKGSENGVQVRGKRIRQAVPLRLGERFKIGPFTLSLHLPVEATNAGPRTTTSPKFTGLHQGPSNKTPVRVRRPTHSRPIFPPEWFTNNTVVPIAKLHSTGFSIEEKNYVALGGGLGSFVWVDHLAVFGARTTDIAVIGVNDTPYHKYRTLCRNSQIPDHERLRSDSGSTPDNVWGWPGYAIREAASDFGRGRFLQVVRLLWSIFGEPTFAQTYTPISRRVFASLEREATRIGWRGMWRFGKIRGIRKTDDGRFVVAYSQGDLDKGAPYNFIIGNYLHLAFGYPAIRLLPDLQEYRKRYADRKKVVNAYEPHDFIYQHLERYGGRVIVRGRGIVASRIIQRLYEARQVNNKITIIHILRSPVTTGQRYGLARRFVENHWEFQPFNWPKAAWGGKHRFLLEESTPERRHQLLDEWGGTTTASRNDWKQIIRQGLREGWYDYTFGQARSVEPYGKDMVLANVEGEQKVYAHFIIDATGLVSDIFDNPVLNDLIKCYNLECNKKRRLHVTNDFEIPGLRNGNARAYASGVMTLGGPYAAVDSFLGLQYAALRSVDHLVSVGAPAIRKMNGLHSLNQFMRWARGVHP